jgi:hypothetical protein
MPTSTCGKASANSVHEATTAEHSRHDRTWMRCAVPVHMLIPSSTANAVTLRSQVNLIAYRSDQSVGMKAEYHRWMPVLTCC